MAETRLDLLADEFDAMRLEVLNVADQIDAYVARSFFTVSNEPQPLRQLLKDLHHSVAFDVAANPGTYNAATSLWSHAWAASPTQYYSSSVPAFVEISRQLRIILKRYPQKSMPPVKKGS